MKNKAGNKNSSRIILIAVVVIFLIIKSISWFSNSTSLSHNDRFTNSEEIILTKHAKCRMDCRNITLEEIKEIIGNGKINKAKSGIGSKGDSTFTLEGISHEQQHIRVVVAPENDRLVVITCIDLEKEWPCNCD